MGALRTGPGGDVCNRRDHVVEPRPAPPLGSAGPASFGISSPPLGAVSRQTSSERSAKATWCSDGFLVTACAVLAGTSAYLATRLVCRCCQPFSALTILTLCMHPGEGGRDARRSRRPKGCHSH